MKKIIKCGPYELNFNQKTLIMGILNATPDSFSDGGRYQMGDSAIRHAKQMVKDGADIMILVENPRGLAMILFLRKRK